MPPPSNEAIIAGIADALPVGVWVARAPGGEFVYANTKFTEIMGMSGRDDVARGEYAEPYQIHDRDGDLYPEDRMPFVRALAVRETVMVDDLVIHRRDGGRVAVRAYARPIFEGDEISHVVIAFFDITREVAAERARAESEAQMRRGQRMEAVGKLAGGIAHDFNNILGAVRAIASTSLLAETDPDKRESLKVIESATASATQLTRSLLGFAGQGKNLAVPLAFDEVVRGVTDIFNRALDSRWTVETEAAVSRRVLGDRGQLEQVVMNLLLNAREAMPDGGTIFVRLRERDAVSILEVEDEGGGVPAEFRNRIFDPYFTTKVTDGQRSTGLGLATAYGIVDAHGGALEVDDGRRGAVFRVTLPGMTHEAAQAQAKKVEGLIRGSGLLLLVDDEPAVRMATRRALEMAGYRVLTAADGVEGVDLFRRRHDEIDAVVLDMSMPRLDGRGAYLEMKKIAPSVRVLLTTGYALNEEAQSILDLGVRGFIEKPFDIYTLSAELARILED